MRKSKVLFFSPGEFFSYRKLIISELENRGYQVTSIDDMIPIFPINKVLRKINLPLLKFLTYNYISKELDNLDYDYKVIFILNGQGFSRKIVELIKSKFHGSTLIGYCWDSLENNKTPLDWIDLLDKFKLFDPSDTVKYKIGNVPLFSAIADYNNKYTKDINFSFIGTIHSDRLKLINNAINNTNSQNYYIFFYERSIFSLLKNFLRSPLLYLKLWKYISLSPLPYDKFLEILRRSYFTLDVSHEAQNGITMRCFESNAFKTGIITNNPYIFYNSCFNAKNARVSLDFKNIVELTKDKPILEDFIQTRTIKNFIDDLFIN